MDFCEVLPCECIVLILECDDVDLSSIRLTSKYLCKITTRSFQRFSGLPIYWKLYHHLLGQSPHNFTCDSGGCPRCPNVKCKIPICSSAPVYINNSRKSKKKSLDRKSLKEFQWSHYNFKRPEEGTTYTSPYVFDWFVKTHCTCPFDIYNVIIPEYSLKRFQEVKNSHIFEWEPLVSNLLQDINILHIPEDEVDNDNSINFLEILPHDCLNLVLGECDTQTLSSLRASSKYFCNYLTQNLLIFSNLDIYWILYKHLLDQSPRDFTCDSGGCPRCPNVKCKIPIWSSSPSYMNLSTKTKKKSLDRKTLKEFQWSHYSFRAYTPQKNGCYCNLYRFSGFVDVGCKCPFDIYDVIIPEIKLEVFQELKGGYRHNWEALITWFLKYIKI